METQQVAEVLEDASEMSDTVERYVEAKSVRKESRVVEGASGPIVDCVEPGESGVATDSMDQSEISLLESLETIPVSELLESGEGCYNLGDGDVYDQYLGEEEGYLKLSPVDCGFESYSFCEGKPDVLIGEDVDTPGSSRDFDGAPETDEMSSNEPSAPNCNIHDPELLSKYVREFSMLKGVQRGEAEGNLYPVIEGDGQEEFSKTNVLHKQLEVLNVTNLLHSENHVESALDRLPGAPVSSQSHSVLREDGDVHLARILGLSLETESPPFERFSVNIESVLFFDKTKVRHFDQSIESRLCPCFVPNCRADDTRSWRTHRVYLLAKGYYDREHSLVLIGNACQILSDQNKKYAADLWVQERCALRPEPKQCGDKVTVSAEPFLYQTFKFNKSKYESLQSNAKQMLSLKCQNMVREEYESMLYKLQLQEYCKRLILNLDTPGFATGSADGGCLGGSGDQKQAKDIEELKLVCDILFYFEIGRNQMQTDANSSVKSDKAELFSLEGFHSTIRELLCDSLGVLLRLMVEEDYAWLFRNLVRCPGVGEWGGHFFQLFPRREEGLSHGSAHHMIHYVNMMRILLSPELRYEACVDGSRLLSGQELFAKIVSEYATQKNRGSQLVLQESDFLKIWQQLDYLGVLDHFMNDAESLQEQGDIEQLSLHSASRFSTLEDLVYILSTSIWLFCVYENFKRQLIAALVETSRKALDYSRALIESAFARAEASELALMIRSQAEHIFLFCFIRIYLDPKLWPYLVYMDYHKLSVHTSISIFCTLYFEDVKVLNVDTFTLPNWLRVVKDSDQRALFVHKVADFSTGEYIFDVLTLLLNGHAYHGQFLRIALWELCQVAFVLRETRFLSKRASRVLAEFCLKYPRFVSFLIYVIHRNLDAVDEKSCLDCLGGVDLGAFTPSDGDLAILEEWLSGERPVPRELAMAILSRLNYGTSSDADQRPYMDPALHRRIAVCIVKGYLGCLESQEGHRKGIRGYWYRLLKEQEGLCSGMGCTSVLLRVQHVDASTFSCYLDSLEDEDPLAQRLFRLRDSLYRVDPAVIMAIFYLTSEGRRFFCRDGDARKSSKCTVAISAFGASALGALHARGHGVLGVKLLLDMASVFVAGASADGDLAASDSVRSLMQSSLGVQGALEPYVWSAFDASAESAKSEVKSRGGSHGVLAVGVAQQLHAAARVDTERKTSLLPRFVKFWVRLALQVGNWCRNARCLAFLEVVAECAQLYGCGRVLQQELGGPESARSALESEGTSVLESLSYSLFVRVRESYLSVFRMRDSQLAVSNPWVLLYFLAHELSRRRGLMEEAEAKISRDHFASSPSAVNKCPRELVHRMRPLYIVYNMLVEAVLILDATVPILPFYWQLFFEVHFSPVGQEWFLGSFLSLRLSAWPNLRFSHSNHVDRLVSKLDHLSAQIGSALTKYQRIEEKVVLERQLSFYRFAMVALQSRTVAELNALRGDAKRKHFFEWTRGWLESGESAGLVSRQRTRHLLSLVATSRELDANRVWASSRKTEAVKASPAPGACASPREARCFSLGLVQVQLPKLELERAEAPLPLPARRPVRRVYEAHAVVRNESLLDEVASDVDWVRRMAERDYGYLVERVRLENEVLSLYATLYAPYSYTMFDKVACRLRDRCKGPACFKIAARAYQLQPSHQHAIGERQLELVRLSADRDRALAEGLEQLGIRVLRLAGTVSELCRCYESGEIEDAEAASRLFLYLLNLRAESAAVWPPSKQLFSYLEKTLFRRVVVNFEDMVCTVFDAMVGNKLAIESLADYWNPNIASSSSFLDMMEVLLTSREGSRGLDEKSKMALLRRFDVARWAKSSSVESVSRLLEVMCGALCQISSSGRHARLFELLLSYVETAAECEFPAHLDLILQFLFDNTRSGKLSPEAWRVAASLDYGSLEVSQIAGITAWVRQYFEAFFANHEYGKALLVWRDSLQSLLCFLARLVAPVAERVGDVGREEAAGEIVDNLVGLTNMWLLHPAFSKGQDEELSSLQEEFNRRLFEKFVEICARVSRSNAALVRRAAESILDMLKEFGRYKELNLVPLVLRTRELIESSLRWSLLSRGAVEGILGTIDHILETQFGSPEAVEVATCFLRCVVREKARNARDFSELPLDRLLKTILAVLCLAEFPYNDACRGLIAAACDAAPWVGLDLVITEDDKIYEYVEKRLVLAGTRELESGGAERLGRPFSASAEPGSFEKNGALGKLSCLLGLVREVCGIEEQMLKSRHSQLSDWREPPGEGVSDSARSNASPTSSNSPDESGERDQELLFAYHRSVSSYLLIQNMHFEDCFEPSLYPTLAKDMSEFLRNLLNVYRSRPSLLSDGCAGRPAAEWRALLSGAIKNVVLCSSDGTLENRRFLLDLVEPLLVQHPFSAPFFIDELCPQLENLTPTNAVRLVLLEKCLTSWASTAQDGWSTLLRRTETSNHPASKVGFVEDCLKTGSTLALSFFIAKWMTSAKNRHLVFDSSVLQMLKCHFSNRVNLSPSLKSLTSMFSYLVPNVHVSIPSWPRLKNSSPSFMSSANDCFKSLVLWVQTIELYVWNIYDLQRALDLERPRSHSVLQFIEAQSKLINDVKDLATDDIHPVPASAATTLLELASKRTKHPTEFVLTSRILKIFVLRQLKLASISLGDKGQYLVLNECCSSIPFYFSSQVQAEEKLISSLTREVLALAGGTGYSSQVNNAIEFCKDPANTFKNLNQLFTRISPIISNTLAENLVYRPKELVFPGE